MTTLDAIKKLHTSMIDTRQAYEKAEQESDKPELKALFADMVAMRYKDHEQLHRVLTAMGEQPDESGSFMSTVHKTVIGVRAAVTGVDEGSLSAFARGEDNILKEYDNALSQADIHPETTSLLTAQKSALMTKIADMKAMAETR